MAYEFNNDDHFDMKSQMMVGKIGENLFLKIYGNSPQCEIDDLRDDAVFQDKDVDFRVRQVKNSEGNPIPAAKQSSWLIEVKTDLNDSGNVYVETEVVTLVKQGYHVKSASTKIGWLYALRQNSSSIIIRLPIKSSVSIALILSSGSIIIIWERQQGAALIVRAARFCVRKITPMITWHQMIIMAGKTDRIRMSSIMGPGFSFPSVILLLWQIRRKMSGNADCTTRKPLWFMISGNSMAFSHLRF